MSEVEDLSGGPEDDQGALRGFVADVKTGAWD